MWCPWCEKETIHKALPKKGSRNLEVSFHFQSDIWKKHVPLGFRRIRQCQECNMEWYSVEDDRSFLQDLIDFYERFAGLKEQMEELRDTTQELRSLLEKLSGINESIEKRYKLFRKGDFVEITGGEFKDQRGCVERVDENRGVVRVQLISSTNEETMLVSEDDLKPIYRYLNQ
jgi:transcription antitermination factor NusG